MKWMIASDLHGSAYYTKKLLQCMETEEPARVLLLGDLLYHGPRNDLPREYAPKEVLAMLNEDMSFFQAAAMLRVPPELLDFKFRVLKRMGYAMNPPLYSQSNFMKNIDRRDRF